MEVLIYLIVVPKAIFFALGFSIILGNSFRNWNEGKDYSKGKSKYDSLKTLLIGLLIFFVIGWLITRCDR